MFTTTQRFQVHHFTTQEIEALDTVMGLLTQLQDDYAEDDILANANDGEIVAIDELARVKGILSFLYMNRVVEVNP
jgi:hypothetical protein